MAALTAAVSGNFSATLTSLLLAFLLGTAIGIERQYRNRSAGLRTNVLVATGAAAFVELGLRLNGNAGAVQVAAYVVSGVGFLGAGVIMRDGTNVRGIDTAATIWATAAVGALAGVGLCAEAVATAVVVLAGNTILRPLVNGINRLPFNERTSEARYQVHVTALSSEMDGLRDVVSDRLEKARYPIRSMRVFGRGDRYSELVVTLVSTAIEPKDLDAVTDDLGRRRNVAYATWSQRTMD